MAAIRKKEEEVIRMVGRGGGGGTHTHVLRLSTPPPLRVRESERCAEEGLTGWGD